MSRIFASVSQLVGATPLLDLSALSEAWGGEGRILAKLEGFNPGGSAKDRVAAAMLEEARSCGVLGPGSVIIEPTSGNTGIGLAMMAAAQGYEAIIVMPDTMSVERRRLMAAYGAKVELTPGALGMQGAIDRANELAAAIPGSLIAGQFVNPANPSAHYRTTGPEIWADTDGQLDLFVAGVGTGGTITGAGRYLKEQKPDLRVVAVEPAGSPLLSGGTAGSHGLQGIGANFIPEVLDTDIYDQVMQVTEQDAYAAGRLLARRMGVLAGISSGAALWAAMELARQPEHKGKTIVLMLPDSGERYLSTPMFGE